MSDISAAFLAFSWLLFAGAVFFHPLTFNHSIVLCQDPGHAHLLVTWKPVVSKGTSLKHIKNLRICKDHATLVVPVYSPAVAWGTAETSPEGERYAKWPTRKILWVVYQDCLSFIC